MSTTAADYWRMRAAGTTEHESDGLAAQVLDTLTSAGHDVTLEQCRVAVRRWWGTSRPNGVPLGYALAHLLPMARTTAVELDALGKGVGK